MIALYKNNSYLYTPYQRRTLCYTTICGEDNCELQSCKSQNYRDIHAERDPCQYKNPCFRPRVMSMTSNKTQVSRELCFQCFVPVIASTPSHMEAESLGETPQFEIHMHKAAIFYWSVAFISGTDGIAS